MKIPAKVIQKEINRVFKMRGQDCICMTEKEYEAKENLLIFKLSRYGYHRELITPVLENLRETKWARIPEEKPISKPPIKIKVEPKPIPMITIPKTPYMRKLLNGDIYCVVCGRELLNRTEFRQMPMCIGCRIKKGESNG